MPIVEVVVHPVSALPINSGSSYINTDVTFDFAIGGLPFLSAASDQYPMERKTADYTKTQIDASTEPGEQTLINWWLRSQSSFHAGTGLLFEEPDGSSTDLIQYRFQDSAGVNVWTPGQVTLLNSTVKDVAASSADPLLMGAIDPAGPTDCYFLADGNVVKRCTGSGSGTTVTWGGTGTVQSMCNDGNNYYIADSVSIWKGTLAGGAGSAVWLTGATPVVVAWVKQRLMAAIGPSIYELVGTGTALPPPIYTHPNPSWIWTSITESPEAIYAAGYAGSTSAGFMFTLDTSGSVPTLTSGIVCLNMPEGEVIHSIYGYLGSFLAIGTNKGVRIAAVQSDGTLQFGPLSVVLPAGAGPVFDMVGVDRYIYCSYSNAIGGNSGLVRLDLGTTYGYQLFAYASDLQSHVTGDVRSVGLLGASDRLVFTVGGNGAYLQSATVLEPSGFLKTGNIRFHILDSKLFKYVRVWTLPLVKGAVIITTNDHAGVPTSLVTFTAGHTDDPLDEVPYPTSYGPQEWTSLTIGLTRDVSDTTSGPTVTAYQIKALPAQKRQRTFMVPLLCFDHEKDARSVAHGYEGSALARVRALEALEEAGDLVRFDDLTRDAEDPRLVLIDNLDFFQNIAPPGGANASGWGGVIMATLRAVD